MRKENDLEENRAERENASAADLGRRLVQTDTTIKWFTVISGLAAVVSAGAAVYAASQISGASAQTDAAIKKIAELATQSQRQADALDIQIGQMKRQADATQMGAAAAQGQLGAMLDEQRPRVYPIGFTGSGPGLWSNRNGTVSVNLQIILKNGGKAEATYAYPFAEFFPRIIEPGESQEDIRGQLADIMRRQQVFCEKIRRRPSNAEASGVTIGPGNSAAPLATYVMSSSDVTAWKSAIERGANVAPIVSGCVDYVFGHKHHQTTFEVEIDKAGGEDHPFLLIDPNADLPVAAPQMAIGLNPSLASHSD